MERRDGDFGQVVFGMSATLAVFNAGTWASKELVPSRMISTPDSRWVVEAGHGVAAGLAALSRRSFAWAITVPATGSLTVGGNRPGIASTGDRAGIWLCGDGAAKAGFAAVAVSGSAPGGRSTGVRGNDSGTNSVGDDICSPR